MIRAFQRCLLIGIFVALCLQGLLAQNPQTPAPPGKSASKKTANARDVEAEQNAVNALLYLRSSANEVENSSERVRVLLEIADALWLSDKELAKDVFKQSFTVASNHTAKEEDAVSRSKSLQQLVISRIAMRDPELARSLLPAPPEGERSKRTNQFGELYGVNGSTGEMLVKAAAEALSSDAAQAAQIARTAAADGVSQQMRLFLLSLRARDRNAGDALFEVLLQNAAAQRPPQLAEALFLWDYAFQRKIIYLGAAAWFREAPTEYPISPDLKRKALAFAVDALVQNAQLFYLANARTDERPVAVERYAVLYSLAAQILPDVQALIPSAVPTVMAQINRLGQELRDQGQKVPQPPEPLPSAAESGDIDKLLERAAGAPNSSVRDAMYARAAYRLYLREDYERALEVSRNIENVELRQKVTDPVRFDWSGTLIDQKRFDTALTVARGIQSAELRAAMLVHLAGKYLTAGDQTQAVAALNEAQPLTDKGKPSVYLASAVLGMAQVYLTLNNNNQARQSTSAAIQMINASDESEGWELLAKSAPKGRLTVTDSQWIAKRGEGVSIRAVYPKVGGLLEVLTKISEASIDEGLTLAREIKPKGLNFATQAALCRQVLEHLHAANKSPRNDSKREVIR